MEIKIQCNCGTKFKFDVEPVDGRVPFAVACPSCGVDGTELANSRIRETLEAAAPAAPTTMTPPPGQLRLRIAHSAAPAAAPAGEAATEAAPAPLPAPKRPFVAPTKPYSPPGDEGLTKEFFLGLAGALVGVVVGCALWYLFFRLTGKNFRIIAVVVGVTGGFGAKILSKDEGSAPLGMITCILVLLGVVFTAYNIGRDKVQHIFEEVDSEYFKSEKEHAKHILEIIPNGTEEEIRKYLARELSDSDRPNPAAVTKGDVLVFQEVRLPHYKELASATFREKDFKKAQGRWAHDQAIAEAKQTMATMPNETDHEILVYLASKTQHNEPISNQQIAAFREYSLPGIKAMASGQVKYEEPPEVVQSSKESDKAMDEGLKSEEESAQGGWVKILYFFSGWGIGGVGVIFLTLGMAYKISTLPEF
jgi:hypothetical protein